MKKLYLLLGVLFLFSFTLVSAPPPSTITNINTQSGLDIFYPSFDASKINTGFDIQIHVANKSTGLQLSNTVVDCGLHLFNSTGDHTLISPVLNKDINGIDHDLFISAGNFSELGKHSFYIFCNSTTLGGEVSGTYSVTKTGELTQSYNPSFYAVLLVALIIFLTLTSLIFIHLPFKNSRNDDGKIISINDLKYLKVLFFFLSYGLLTWIANVIIEMTTQYMSTSVVLPLFTSLFKVMIGALYPIMILTIISMIIMWINDSKLKKWLERGF